jgi:Holliday junction resolvasome RuvABC endonuclease subunit
MGKPVVIALDPATHCGCAVGEVGGRPKLSSVTMRDSRDDPHEDVFGRAVRWIEQVIERHHPVLIAIEKPFYVNERTNYATTVVLHGIYAGFTGAARARNVTVWPVTAATWRKHTLGTSKLGSRDDVKDAMVTLCRRLDWSAPDDNAADAAGIWIWATAKYAPYGAVPVEPLFTGAMR